MVTLVERTIKKFRFINDRFARVALSDEAVEYILQVILEDSTLKVETVYREYKIDNLFGRTVILDILAIDIKGKEYNIELQFYYEGASYGRSEYYSSMIHVGTSKLGTSWSQLPDTTVIFITKYDIFGKGKPIYRFGPEVMMDGQVISNVSSKRSIIYVITTNGFDDGSELGKLKHDLLCEDPDEMYSDILKDCMKKAKNAKGDENMCDIMYEYGQAVLDECAPYLESYVTNNTKVTMARNMLDDGMPLDLVVKYLGLSKVEVQKIQKEM